MHLYTVNSKRVQKSQSSWKVHFPQGLNRDNVSFLTESRVSLTTWCLINSKSCTQGQTGEYNFTIISKNCSSSALETAFRAMIQKSLSHCCFIMKLPNEIIRTGVWSLPAVWLWNSHTRWKLLCIGLPLGQCIHTHKWGKWRHGLETEAEAKNTKRRLREQEENSYRKKSLMTRLKISNNIVQN